MSGILEDVARLKSGRTRRISSYDRSGGNADKIQIASGEVVDIARIAGAGVIKHIWFTMGSSDPLHYRNTLLRMYWDGEKKPSVESPIGDFFGQGWGEAYPYVSLPICASQKRSGNCYFPMPFSNGARIEIENDSNETIKSFYYYVDYEERDALPADMARIHAQWRRTVNVPPQKYDEHGNLHRDPTLNLTDKRNHVFMDAKGQGHYVGINYYVDSPTPQWYGEGDDMFFIDGEPWPPSLHGTGTEDYFCSSWSPKEIYCHPYFGYPRVNNNVGYLGRTHCYRFHIEDPVIFTRSLRGSIECGHANGLTLDLATVAYWYQMEPHKPFAQLPGRAGRTNMPEIGRRELHAWRIAWQQMMGKAAVWGNEDAPKRFSQAIRRKAAAAEKELSPPANVRAAKREAQAQENMLNRRKAAQVTRRRPK